jgi:hypothetical protein
MRFTLCDRCGQSLYGHAQEVLIFVPPGGLMRGEISKARDAVGMFFVGFRQVGNFLFQVCEQP